MLTTKEIMEYTTSLEMSNAQTIRHFMQKKFGFDWDKEKILIELYNILDKIMVKEEEQHPNGYKIINWVSR